VNESSRRTGRPRLDEHDRTIDFSVRVTTAQFDDLYRLAQRERTTMADVTRRALRRACRSASEEETE
jgi:hypothetical protein